ncbi:MAG: hypothetical protein HZA58_02995 [Acidimicrobiia bacterium]|nr:hypothetical protein [Acidimicrobiia bacterium]
MLTFLVVATALPLATAAGGGQGNSAQSEHQRIVDFWTPERVAQAQPRDFILDPATRQYRPTARPGGGGGGGTVVSGSSWNGGGAVTGTTGKVLFAMAGSYYVCSASTVFDTASDRSIVLTAGHCVYDETNGGFATNWMFVPDYDSAPATLTTSGSFCSQTRYGCWTAASLAVDSEFATAGGFNDQAVQHDWGFAVLGLGGKSTPALVENVVGTQNIQFTTVSFGTEGYAFGYPAEGKWKGNDLIYCRGPVDGDPYTTNDAGQPLTYRMNGCKLNGGSSGGPWLRGFNGSTGTLFSVNSYGYLGIAAMHGPFFNAETAASYNAALTVAFGTNVQTP